MKINKEKEKQLNHNRLLGILDYKKTTGIFTWKDYSRKCKGKEAGTLLNSGYVRIKIGGIGFLAHRLAWFYVYGEWPKDDIDHKDGNKTHNWIKNLRPATNTMNQQNSPKRKTDNRLKGVYFESWKKTKPYRASIACKGKRIWLGNHDTEDQAHAAYCRAAESLFGSYARFK